MQRSASGRFWALSHWCACWYARRSATQLLRFRKHRGTRPSGPVMMEVRRLAALFTVGSAQTELAVVIVNGEPVALRYGGSRGARSPSTSASSASSAAATRGLQPAAYLISFIRVELLGAQVRGPRHGNRRAFEYTPCRSGLPSGVRGMVQALAAGAGFAATCDCPDTGDASATTARANNEAGICLLILLFQSAINIALSNMQRNGMVVLAEKSVVLQLVKATGWWAESIRNGNPTSDFQVAADRTRPYS